ncbi:MerR family transcriptional regulator [Anaerobacillus alkalidiazotrophicus]|nr:MerR family transcriptional regulator [Anaerobacillus alkalidiazotrophicus]
MGDKIRRNMPLFPIGIIKKLTELTPRQIRYYEEHGLIFPIRTDGNQRLYSFNDVDRLLEIKELIEQGINISGIKQIFIMKQHFNGLKHNIIENPDRKVQKDLTEKQLRSYLKNELLVAGRHGKASLIQGELSRFFH